MQYGVAIIGCGGVAKKRALQLGRRAKLLWCIDLVADNASLLAKSFAARSGSELALALADDAVQIVIVATTHESLAQVALAAIKAGKHVLLEKPAARNAAELSALRSFLEVSGLKLRIGYNHRYHPAILQAKKILTENDCGKLLMLRARYGHGGRLGYEQEWRADQKKSGGGELIDQGVHLIDLARWFMGEFISVFGLTPTLYWKMPVDDNAFLTLQTAAGQVAFLHASCSEWKNLFSLEIYSERAKLQVDGLGGSYGTERLTYYKMLPQMGVPESESWEYPGPDLSWGLEFEEFIDDISLNRMPTSGLADGIAVLEIVDKVYQMQPQVLQKATL